MYKNVLGVWLALMTLALLSLGSAYLPLGIWNSAASMGIATVKVALVAIFFMHVKSAAATVRIFACAGLFTLILLLGLSQSDLAVRHDAPAPWATNP